MAGRHWTLNQLARADPQFSELFSSLLYFPGYLGQRLVSVRLGHDGFAPECGLKVTKAKFLPKAVPAYDRDNPSAVGSVALDRSRQFLVVAIL